MVYYIGLDLGGTSIKAGVVTGEGKVLSRLQQMVGTTPEERKSTRVAQLLHEVAQRAAAKANISMDQVTAIGIGSPGILDADKGVIIAAANFEGWKNVPITSLLSKASGLPCYLDNDANAAMLAELWVGAARNKTSAIMLTLGTGIGGGIFVNGGLVRGAEVGHSIFVPEGRQCGCGQRGCFEKYASATGVLLSAREREDLSTRANLTTKDVFALARDGHSEAASVIEQWVDIMAIGILNICRSVDPQVVILGGGVAKNPGIIPKINDRFAARTWRFATGQPPVVTAEVRNDAGLIGAAYVAVRASPKSKL